MIPQMEIAVFIGRLWREAVIWSRELLIRAPPETPEKLLKKALGCSRLTTR
jgi:hypothetical protein